MSDKIGRTGKVRDMDEVDKFGHIDVKYEKKLVYLPPEEAGDLEEGVEVVFDIEVVNGKPHAVNVKRK
ncbi:hypothetical protein ACX0KM_23180 [Pseudomonas promysalinigenes]